MNKIGCQPIKPNTHSIKFKGSSESSDNSNPLKASYEGCYKPLNDAVKDCPEANFMKKPLKLIGVGIVTGATFLATKKMVGKALSKILNTATTQCGKLGGNITSKLDDLAAKETLSKTDEISKKILTGLTKTKNRLSKKPADKFSESILKPVKTATEWGSGVCAGVYMADKSYNGNSDDISSIADHLINEIKD